MPTSAHAPAEDPPVFTETERVPTTSTTAHPSATPAPAVSDDSSAGRDESRHGTTIREPVAAEEPFVDDSTQANGGGRSRLSRRQALERLVIHEHRPIENLPEMKAAELKLIGRCVSLCLMRSVEGVTEPVHYTGLVSSVSHTTVTLMCVNRYTHDDFKVYRARERGIGRAGYRAHAAAVHNQGTESGLPAHGYTEDGEVGMDADGGLASTQDPAALADMDAAGSLAPALPLPSDEGLQLLMEATAEQERQDRAEAGGAVAGEAPVEMPASGDAAESRAARRRHFRAFDGSVGPIPYVTFLRKSINDVEFGRDPRSAFYALFQDPARAITDMQYLRMFVRRYLVHTSEHNNPRQVPVYAFLAVRLGWPTLDRGLVNQLVREELPNLMVADRAIEKERKRAQQRSARAGAAVLRYQAPEGLFSRTGILYLTNLPQVTFASGIGISFFAVAFVVFLGVALGVVREPLMVNYMVRMLGYFIPAIAVWLAASASVILHSLTVCIPVRSQLQALVMRTVWGAGAVGCVVMVVVVCAERLRNDNIYAYINAASPSDLCAFYDKYRCSGFMDSCSSTSAPMWTSACASLPNYSDPCSVYVWNRVQLLLIPLLAFAAMVGLFVLYSFFLLWKVLGVASSIARRVR